MKIKLVGFESGRGVLFNVTADDDTELALLNACSSEKCTFQYDDSDEDAFRLTCTVGMGS